MPNQNSPRGNDWKHNAACLNTAWLAQEVDLVVTAIFLCFNLSRALLLSPNTSRKHCTLQTWLLQEAGVAVKSVPGL